MEEGAKKKGRKIGIGTCFFLFILFLITILGKKDGQRDNFMNFQLRWLDWAITSSGRNIQ